MTIPSDAELRAMTYEDLMALADTDPELDVAAAIARVRDLNKHQSVPTVTALRARARSTMQGTPPTPDALATPIAARRAEFAAAHSRKEQH